jgi:FkbM family methyltransferase
MRVSELVGNKGRIIAIEATDENSRIVELNVKYNKMNNISVINKAVWNSHGQIEFFRESGAVGNAFSTTVDTNNNSYKVECDTLYNILKHISTERVDFIRIQINGSELKDLYGMEKILRSKPKLLSATRYVRNDGKNIVKEVKSFLASKNYKNIIFEGDHTFAF